MDKVNVLIVSGRGLYEGYLEDIAAVDPRISVRDGREQYVVEIQKTDKNVTHKGPLEQYIEERFVEEISRGRDLQALEAQEDMDTLLAQAEVIYASLLFPVNLLPRAPRLKWIHWGNTGIDRYLSTGIFDGDVTVTNSRGVPAIPMAEHALTFMFMLAHNAPRLLDAKKGRRWDRFVFMELRDKTVGIVGLGAVGGEIARLAKGVGMRVIATDKAAIQRGSRIWGVDELYTTQGLHEMLSESDFVIITAPLTAETRGMINERELQAMKTTAYVINVARGAIIDEPALIKALKEGWIAGAGLDAFEIEPLPTDNELWELPNVILSPHMAGSGDRPGQRVIGLFCDNLRRYLAGEQLVNVVDIRRGF